MDRHLPPNAALAALRIDGARLWQSLMDLAQIGATPKGGVCRIALTDLDRQGRDLFVQWARGAGCSIRVDAIGNIFARRAGQDDNLPPVMTGSHIDTQPTGGKFDGNYGVLAGLEVVRTLNAASVRTRAPIEVAVWTNEEGSRFVPVMMGSGVFAGAFTLEHALVQRDAQGVSVGEALASIGYAGQAGPAPAVSAYFEAHIEQGPVLENHQRVIGVVTAALGQRWYDVSVQGMEAHAGPTPMELRRDALLAASELVLEVNRIAVERAPHARSTVGTIEVFPNSRNVIPGRATLSVDLRAPDDAQLLDMDAAMRAACARIATERSLQVTVEQVVYFPPQPFTPQLVQAVRANADDLGYSSMDVVSGAGHDAVYLARVAPAAMIFVPCDNGISHNEIENADPTHLEAGCNVLLRAVLAAAEGVA
ncbi:MAG: Zn-dependent hydrolase [Comamonas sp. SCN 65-56]|mgnify:FL=1|uniref:Zn-dependent hydrolase n=1 Tax=Comamonas sp. SCN 65-56 TaxID=1660095 RepID=UPI00086CB48B|nr:Zn-dependent hydrolase [Comamonas sp. SCN 65-56]ODS90406.1 MAG: Zn-dependent hydrolase [Comamonas sp. SCN 65-56]